MSIDRKDSSAKQEKANGRKAAATDVSRKPADHRLRGEELDNDFSDAEGDSCVVAPKRDYKESDS